MNFNSLPLREQGVVLPILQVLPGTPGGVLMYLPLKCWIIASHFSVDSILEDKQEMFIEPSIFHNVSWLFSFLTHQQQETSNPCYNMCQFGLININKQQLYQIQWRFLQFSSVQFSNFPYHYHSHLILKQQLWEQLAILEKYFPTDN